LPGSGAFAYQHLDKSAGFGRVFPWRRAFARLQAHHDITDAARFARFQRDILRIVVALVDQAKRRDPVLQRRANTGLASEFRRRRACQLFGKLGFFGHRGRCASAAGRNRQTATKAGHRDQRRAWRDHASGVHAS